MNSPDRLDELVDALRQPATSAELAGQAQAIDAFASAVISTKGTSMQILSNSRRLRVASFVAAGIIGFGGVAAAGPAVLDTMTGDDDPSTTVEEAVEDTVATTEVVDDTVSESTVETTVPASTMAPDVVMTVDEDDDVPDDDAEVTARVELVDDPDTSFDETECAEGNHGKTVSSVAKETPSGPGKGAVVSEAAHSSCGKKDKSESDDDVEVDDDDQSDDDVDESGDADADDQSDDDNGKSRDTDQDKGDGGQDKGNGGKNKGDGGQDKGNGGKNRGNGKNG